MSAQPASLAERIATSRPILFAFFLVAAMLVGFSAVRFQAPELLGQDKVLTDFDAFHIAGTLAARGDVADAYRAERMIAAQAEISGTPSFMPWTYPPPFTLLMEVFAALPIGTAFALFALASFGCYLFVLHRIAGPYLPGALLVVMPVVLLNLRTGQNGMLIAALIGSVLLAWRDRRPQAGFPLGLMIVKPHLAAGVGLLTLFGRRWGALAIAALVALAVLVLATLAYGLPVWSAFFGAAREASAFLAEGYYPLYRMNSAYAALHSFGLPPAAAMAGHVVVALTALALLTWTCTAALPFPQRGALVCALSLFVSPYNYDYDLAMLGLAAALLLPDLLRRATGAELATLVGLAWMAGGYGIALSPFAPDVVAFAPGDAKALPSLIFPLLLALCLFAARLVTRPQAENGVSVPAAA